MRISIYSEVNFINFDKLNEGTCLYESLIRSVLVCYIKGIIILTLNWYFFNAASTGREKSAISKMKHSSGQENP